jgi:hypothetical protein
MKSVREIYCLLHALEFIRINGSSAEAIRLLSAVLLATADPHQIVPGNARFRLQGTWLQTDKPRKGKRDKRLSTAHDGAEFVVPTDVPLILGGIIRLTAVCQASG